MEIVLWCDAKPAGWKSRLHCRGVWSRSSVGGRKMGCVGRAQRRGRDLIVREHDEGSARAHQVTLQPAMTKGGEGWL